MKVVVVHIEMKSGRSLYEVPQDHDLKVGQTVLCDTRQGRLVGIALCDSFEIGGHSLSSLASAFGDSLPLGKIIGVQQIIEWDR